MVPVIWEESALFLVAARVSCCAAFAHPTDGAEKRTITRDTSKEDRTRLFMFRDFQSALDSDSTRVGPFI